MVKVVAGISVDYVRIPAGVSDIVGVNVDKKRADAEKFLAQFPARFTIGYDEAGATPATYTVKKMPSSFVIDRDGRISAAHSGFSSESRDEVESRIRAALAGR